MIHRRFKDLEPTSYANISSIEFLMAMAHFALNDHGGDEGPRDLKIMAKSWSKKMGANMSQSGISVADFSLQDFQGNQVTQLICP